MIPETCTPPDLLSRPPRRVVPGVTALVMAGGCGERMRASLGPAPKTLVPVRGVPLLERCLTSLLMAGIRDVAVAVSRHRPEVGHFVASRGAALVRSLGGTIRCLEEDLPRGTIGAAASLRGQAETLLVLNGDNLTAIDLAALVAHHRRGGAAMTIATHEEPFRLPFGEVEITDGRVTAYREKPERRFPVSSGTYILGAEAIAALPPGESVDVPRFVEILLARGSLVLSFGHNAPWVDVNDASSLERAERLVEAHLEKFERGPGAPDREMLGLVIRRGSALLVERRDDDATCYPGLWGLPGAEIEPGGSPQRALRAGAGPVPLALETFAVFDDIDPASGSVVRHRIFISPESGSPLGLGGRPRGWVAPDGLAGAQPLSPVVVRVLAALGRRS